MANIWVIFSGLDPIENWPSLQRPVAQLVVYIEGAPENPIHTRYVGNFSDTPTLVHDNMINTAIGAARAAGHDIPPTAIVVLFGKTT